MTFGRTLKTKLIFQRTPLNYYKTYEFTDLRCPGFQETTERQLDDSVELDGGSATSRAIADLRGEVPQDSTLRYKVTNNRVKAQVSQRDDALLTALEIKQRWRGVAEAMDKRVARVGKFRARQSKAQG